MRPAQLLYIRQGSSLLVRVVGVAYLGSPAEWKSAAFSEVFGTSSVNNHFPFPTGTWMTSLRRHFSAPNDERKMRMSFPIWCKLAKFPLRVFDQATGKSHVNFFGVAMMISFSSIFFSRFVFFPTEPDRPTISAWNIAGVFGFLVDATRGWASNQEAWERSASTATPSQGRMPSSVSRDHGCPQ